MDRHTLPTRAEAGGFTLPEVMIAMLVLAIGLLGLAALQTAGLRATGAAGMRTLAFRLAGDLIERMHANPAGVAAHEYVIARTTPASLGTPPTRASRDLTDWRNAIARLPDGLGEIAQCTPATTPACPVVDGRTTHVVTVYWNEARVAHPGTFHCPPVSDADFRCFRLITR